MVVPVDCDMQAWIKLFENLDLGVDLRALNDAFQENNVELFKGLLSNILNNLSISNKVKVKASMSLVGGDVHVSGGMLDSVPLALVAIVAIVAMLLSLVVANMTTCFLSAVVFVAVCIKYWVSSKGKTTVPLSDPRTALVDACPALGGIGSAPSKYTLQLMDKAKMPKLTPEQDLLCNDLTKTFQSHVIVTHCKHISSVFVAKVNCGEDLSHLATTIGAAMKKEAANEVVKQKVLTLHSTILKCDDAIWEKKNRYVELGEFQKKMARVCKGWIPLLQNLEKKYGSVLSEIKARLLLSADFAVAKSAVVRRDHVYQAISDKVVGLQEEVRTLSNMKNEKLVLRETVDASRSMMEGIVHSSSLAALEQEALTAAIKQTDLMFRRRCEASDALEAEQVLVTALTKEIKDEEHALDRQISSVKADLALAQSVKTREGQGFWKIQGTPTDETSCKLRKAWDSGNFSKLRHYKCGDFELRFVSKLSESQNEARKMQDKLEEELKHHMSAKVDLTPKRQERAKKIAYVKNLIDLHEKAKEDHKVAERNLKVGVNNLPPAHAAQVLGMQRVSEAMCQSAKTFQPCRAEMESFELLLDDLQNLLEEKGIVKTVLEAVAALSVQANDVEVSSLILLKNLGEANLNDFLLPAVDPGAACTILSEDQDLQRVVDKCEQQLPIECD